jgi:hypothetical protein
MKDPKGNTQNFAIMWRDVKYEKGDEINKAVKLETSKHLPLV